MKRLVVNQDNPGTKIVVNCDSSPVKYAAEELQRWIEQITGLRLQIVPSAGNFPFIAVGKEASDDHFGSLPLFGKEDFVIRENNGNLLIAGGMPRGTLYGVYTFLEDYCGCRWFTSSCSHIPKSKTISVPVNLNVYRKPAFEYRETFYSDAFDGDWCARNKSNGGFHSQLKEHHGGAVRYTKGWFVHTYMKMVPPEVYGESHPEYYALVNGVRQVHHSHPQLCVSNPDVLAISIDSALKALRADPNSTIISISQNDGKGPCQCLDCQAIVDEEGSQSGPILRFVNAVAEAIEQEFPHVEVDTLAYAYSRKPPSITKPRHNVAVRLCSYECCFSHAMNDCRQMSSSRKANGTPSEYADFAADVEAWAKLTNRLYIWDYISNFELSTVPLPNLHVLGSNIRFLTQSGVKGVFSQGIYFARNGGEMAELRAYLNAKLLWDPTFDTETGIQEFLAAWVGPAADQMIRYINLLREELLSTGWHLGIYDSPVAPFFSSQFLDKADLLFDEAEKLVMNMPVEYARVLKERLSIRFVRFFHTEPAADREKQVDEFLRDAAVHGIDRFSEKWSKYVYIRRMLVEGAWPPKFSPKDYTLEV